MSQERREFNIEMAQQLGRIEGKLDSLCGPQGRVTQLEAANTRHFWLSVAIAPALALLHGFARKAGIDV